MPHPIDAYMGDEISLKDACDMPYDTHSAAPIHGTLVGASSTPSGRDSSNGNLYCEFVDDKQHSDASSSFSFDNALAHLASTHDQEVGRLKSEISQLRGEVATLRARTSKNTATSIDSKGCVQPDEVHCEVEDIANSILPERSQEDKDHGSLRRVANQPARANTASASMRSSGPAQKQKSVVLISEDVSDIEVFDSRLSDNFMPASSVLGLPNIVEKWLNLVEGALEVARTKRQYALRDDWVKPDHFISKMERQHGGSLDMQVLVLGVKKHTANRNSVMMSAAAMALLPTTVAKGNWLLHPSSRVRLSWVFVGMMLVVYDIIVLPLNAFPLPDDIGFKFIQWFAQIFWTLDIFLTFCTATYKDGDLVKEWKRVAKIYSRTWLPFDLIVVVPLWLVVFLDAEGAGRSTTLVKYARMLRFMRLARLAKLEKLLNEVLGALNSSMLLLFLSMVKLIIMMVVAVHFIACLWYAAGSSNSGGWAENFRNQDLGYLYITSMHWSFSQFQGTSDILPRASGSPFAERCVATFTILVSLVILSSFVSSLTNIMIRIQIVRTQMNAMDDAVRLFLSENDISWHLSLRVKKFVDWNQRLAQSRESTAKVVEILPKALQMDLQEEVRGPLILVHKLFQALQNAHGRMFRQVCFEALNTLVPAPSEIIFNQGEVSHFMYFITLGKYRYIEPLTTRGPTGQSMHKTSLFALSSKGFEDDIDDPDLEHANMMEITKGGYLSEGCLWTYWEHLGILLGMKKCSHIVLEQAGFSRIAKDNPMAHASCIVYGRRFVGGLNRFGKKFSDVIDNKELSESGEGDDDKPTGRKTSVGPGLGSMQSWWASK